MSEWISVKDKEPPKGCSVLVYGRAEDTDEVRFYRPSIYTAYWDEIDKSFCLSGATWMGPFIEPTHWMPLPEPPEAA